VSELTYDPYPLEEEPAGRNLQHIVLQLLMVLVMVCEFLFSTRLFRIINDLLQPALLGVMLAVVLLSGAVVALRGNFRATLLLFAAFSYIALETVNYSILTGDELILTSMFQYIQILLFIFVVWYVEELGVHAFHRVLAAFAFVYAGIYVVLVLGSIVGAVPSDVVKAMVLGADERGDRLYLHGASVIFLFHAALNRRPGRGHALNLPLSHWVALGLSSSAVLLSQSRVLIAVWAGVALLRLFRVSARACAFLCTWGLFITFLLTVLAVVRDDLNPFSIFSNDVSASVRAISFSIARNLILQHPVLGVGLESTGLGLANFVGFLVFHWSDLGPVGIWFAFGLVGLMLALLLAIVIAFVPVQFRDEIDQRCVVALRYTGCTYAIYGVISPTLFTALIPSGLALGYILSRTSGGVAKNTD
jgi:hypothetical protein